MENPKARTFFLILAVTLLSACAVKLTDLTPDPAPYGSPLNLQEFTAEVVPPPDHEIREVSLLRTGRRDPMRNSRGDIWTNAVPIPVCDDVVAYKFLVEYDDTGDTTRPFSSKTFPGTGSFIRSITVQPEDCSTVPTSGRRAFPVSYFADTTDVTPGDGLCEDAAAECSLRAAILEANALPGLNLIELPRGIYRLSLTGSDTPTTPDASMGDLDITDSVVIRTAGECTHTLNDLFVLPTVRDVVRPLNDYTGRLCLNSVRLYTRVFGQPPSVTALSNRALRLPVLPVQGRTHGMGAVA